jgi:hypothetical protein
MFEGRSATDTRRPTPVNPPIPEVVGPILPEEYTSALRDAKNGAPGPDGIDRNFLRQIPADGARHHMHLWMASGMPPSQFKIGITVPIPKTADSARPSDFRPITMNTMIARFFHRVMGRRLEALVPMSPRQKAFRNGLADNVTLLRSILSDRQARNRGTVITFIDVAKAFDSVSHQSIIIAARRMGVPEIWLEYIRNLYSGGTTRLRVGVTLGAPIQVRRGVRQGDPLSPILFNFVINWVLSTLDPLLGVPVGNGLRLNHLAFADDVSLVAETSRAMTALVAAFEKGLALVGLKPNEVKSASLRITGVGKRKKWICDPSPFLTLNDRPVPSLSVEDCYKYLGVRIGARRAAPTVGSRLDDHLRNLGRAPLKPQQRLYFLRVHVIPGLYHQLVLDRITIGHLKKFDIAIRRMVRKWCRLPHNTARPFFHASAKEGGLGLPELLVTVPLLRKNRLDGVMGRVNAGTDPILTQVMKNSPSFNKELRAWGRSRSSYGVVVHSKATALGATARALHDSVDGRGLAFSNHVPSVHNWVTSGTSLLTGRNFINAIHVRAGTLHTALRTARGKPGQSRMCDCCGRLESLSHILQVCPRPFVARDERHNRIAQAICRFLEGKGFTISEEPAIPTTAGTRRPDLIAYKVGGPAAVLDVTIVADNADLNSEHRKKVSYYNTPEIRDWTARLANCEVSDILFTAAVLNWRGALSVLSAGDMTRLGVKSGQLELLSVRVLEHGYKIWKMFKDGSVTCLLNRYRCLLLPSEP